MAPQVDRPTDRASFDIGIICTLPVEFDAVESIIDPIWEDTDQHCFGKAPGDSNAYTLGAIGRHNVVLAFTPGMGKVHAAIAATSFRASFPNIRLALVVGVCGGVPKPVGRKDELYLGDVIVSTEIVQVDLGRLYADRLVRKDTVQDSLGRPNIELRSFLSQLQGRRLLTKLRERTVANVEEIYDTDAYRYGSRPSWAGDKLYRAEYRHKHHDPSACAVCARCVRPDDAVCDLATRLPCKELGCQDEEVEVRGWSRATTTETDFDMTTTQTRRPQIHFGPLASADMVMKSAMHRDQLARREQILGIEMEGAGVWDSFPTIVVKSASDYADSHKDKQWQEYSAVIAAACVKAMLAEWRGIDRPASGRAQVDAHHSLGFTMPRDDQVVFNNYGDVKNQVGTQTINGSMHF